MNIKKAQFMAPHDMVNVVDKARSAAQAAGVNGETIMVCERGASFGYNNLGHRHAQPRDHARDRLPGGVRRDAQRAASGRAGHQLGRPARVRSGAWRARRSRPASQACSWRLTPIPANAKSDGPNAWPLDRMESLLTTLVELDRIVKERGFEEASL